MKNHQEKKARSGQYLAIIFYTLIAFRKKIGFSVPMVQWFSEEKYRPQLERALFGDISAAFFDQEYLKRIWNHYLKGNWNIREIIYAAYVFVLWVETCFENRP